MAGALMIWDGSAWQVVSQQGPAGNNSLWVGPSAPPGTPVTGDEWFDTDEPSTGLTLPLSVANGGTGAASASAARSTLAMPGEELAYNQITATVNITVTTQAAPNLVIEGTSRNYDGSPVMVEFMTGQMQSGAGQTVINLWDGSTDLGYLATLSPNVYVPVSVSRRITPTAGTHNYRIVGWVSGGSGGLINAGTAASSVTWCPAYIRVTRA